MRFSEFIARACVGLALVAGFASSALAADGAKPVPENTLSELQGRWYAAREKVTVDVKGSDVVIAETTSTASWPVHAKFQPGLVIARLENPAAKYGPNQINFSGACWTMGGGKAEFNLNKCSDSGMAYYETRSGKPYWKLNIGNLLLLRKEQIGQWESSRK